MAAAVARARGAPGHDADRRPGARIGAAPPALVIDVIDRSRLEVTAVGWFSDERAGPVIARLAQLVSGGSVTLHLDFGGVTHVGPHVVDALAAARSTLEAAGGSLVISGGPHGLDRRLAGATTQDSWGLNR